MSAGTSRVNLTRNHVEDLRGRLNIALRERDAPASIVRMTGAVFSSFLDPAFTAVSQLGRDVDRIGSQFELTDTARRERVDAEVAEARTEIEELLAGAERQVVNVQADLERLAAPPRPSGDVVELEAQLANLRADVLLWLEAAPEGQLIEHAVALVRHYVVTGNDLGIWFLTAPASDFMWLYLTAHDGPTAYQRYSVAVAAAIAPMMPQPVKAARELLPLISEGEGCLRYIVELARPAIMQRVDEIGRAPLPTPDPTPAGARSRFPIARP